MIFIRFAPHTFIHMTDNQLSHETVEVIVSLTMQLTDGDKKYVDMVNRFN